MNSLTRRQKKTLCRILAAGALTIIAALLPLEGYVRGAAFAVPYLLVGRDVIRGALRKILHGEVLDEEFLMMLATAGAFAIGEYPEAASVMLFYELGELFQSIAVGKSRRSIAALMDIRPDSAAVLRDGEEVILSPEEVHSGETILVRPGERIPLDGIVLRGQGAVNTAALTGESAPVNVTEGSRVLSGSISLNAVLEIQSEGTYAESTVARILELVENSSEKKARVENFITRFARWYTPCVVIGAVLLAVLPPLLSGGEWRSWLNRALVFLVVSCPCALVVSVPLSFFGGLGRAGKDGILIKGANYLEALSGVDTVAFDKTGTVTEGSFAVEAIHPGEISAGELLELAAAAESRSTHPVAESIAAHYGKSIAPERLGAVEELSGLGIRAVVDGEVCYVGNGKLMERCGADWHECHLRGTVVHIARGSEYLGHIIINDRVKPDSAAAIRELHGLGIRSTVMLTGDREEAAARAAEAVSVDSFKAGLLPAEKVEQVEELLKGGAKLAFVGDGINDAPVLMRADVGIAMGALGSDAAIESADIVIMDDKLTRIPQAIRLSRRTMRIVRENVILSLGVKALILLLGALGYAGMWIAVFGDVGVMVLAVLNATRVLMDRTAA